MNFSAFSWTTVLYIAVFTSCFAYLTWPLPWKLSRPLAIAILICGLAVTYIRSDSSLHTLLVRYLIFELVFVLWAVLVLNVQRLYAVYLATFFTVLMGVWVSCIDILLSLFGIHDRTILTLVTGFCRVLSVFIIRNHGIRIDGTRTMPLHQILLGMMPAAACFVANLEMMDFLSSVSQSGRAANPFFVLLSVFFFGFTAIAVLLSSESYFTAVQAQQEKERAQQQLQAQYRLFLQEKDADDRLRALHHDLKNHLDTLEAMSHEQSIRNYIDNLREAEARTLHPFQTGNSTLDALLLTKQEMMEQEGIDFSCLVHFTKLDILSPMEICTLFANGIDNAVEANCNNELPRDQRFLRLSGGEVNGNIVVRMENPFLHTLTPKQDLLRSSKPDPSAHGYGMSNMQDIVSAHNGTLTYEAKDNTFTLYWSIPVT
ncbi:MAG: sensor histidine kinase [Oscillospiraceae bacterium]|nr:sensor histidine kinase [Oscillospiraceae bacterium]